MMKENKKEITKEEIIEVADESKREFIKKFGKYASSAPLMGVILMTAGTSKAHAGSGNSDVGP
jgi:hypothetical protein